MTFPCPLCNCLFNCLNSCTYHIMLMHSSAPFSNEPELSFLSNYDANCLIPAGLQQMFPSEIINVDNNTMIGSQLTPQAIQLATYQLLTDAIQNQPFAKHGSVLNLNNQGLNFLHESYSNLLPPCNTIPNMESIQSTFGLNYMPNLLTDSQLGADVSREQVYSSTDITTGNTLYPTYGNGNTDVGNDSGEYTGMTISHGRSLPQQCFINACDALYSNVTEPIGTVKDDPYMLDKCHSHLQGKVYMCGHCSYTTLRKDNLRSHIRIHANKKPYKCAHCPYMTAHSGNLTTHIRTHSGEKPFKCDRCPYASAHRSHLKCHKRIHTGDKPYKCDECSYASADSSSLRIHVRVHNGYKPHKCRECSYTTSGITSLKAHMLRHTLKQKFQCDTCSYSCSDFHHLRTHMRKHH